jgi:hypothetical protein
MVQRAFQHNRSFPLFHAVWHVAVFADASPFQFALAVITEPKALTRSVYPQHELQAEGTS